mmetsp:Transcript_80581/g.261124  ORF Transcript_80581/g.261124 Transcript_80581/m.261124 type:complete len:210 (+) Transcript_80581:210-839(+)
MGNIGTWVGGAGPDGPCLLVYHERQRASLCGLHAVNNLLQRWAFTERDLYRIARRLDRAEKDLLVHRKRNAVLHAVTGGRAGYKMERHANHSGWGDFSIQVLELALRPFGVQLVLPGNPDFGDPWGFVVNSNDHWAACRQIGDSAIWVSVDSTLTRPQLMSVDDVTRLMTAKPSRARTVFHVVGDVPPSPTKNGRRIVQMSLRTDALHN